MSDYCADCGTEHHWLACPEVSQSVFPHDPEWDAEEPPPPMVANVPTTVYVDPENAEAWRAAGYQVWTPIGPRWDPATPE